MDNHIMNNYKSVVSLIKTDNFNYDYSILKKDIISSLNNLGGIKKFVKPNQKVLIKPNLFGLKCPNHAITNYNFIKAVCEIVIEAGGIPTIGELVANDSPGVNKRAFKEKGMYELAKELGIKLNDFQVGKFITTKIKNHLVLPEVDVSEAMFKYDVIINLPKFKGHPCTYITGAVKNCFGCIRPEQRGQIHKKYSGDEFPKAIVDTYSAMKFNLTIMDAIVGMDGNEAPAYGDEVKIGYIVSGTDAVAIDAIVSKMTGHDLNYIPTVKFGHINGIGTGVLSKIKILGDKPSKVKFNYHKNYLEFVSNSQKNINSNLKNNLGIKTDTSFPKITKSCISCLTCLNICPASAISYDGLELKIDYTKCVKCYRCLEVCPAKAIKLG